MIIWYRVTGHHHNFQQREPNHITNSWSIRWQKFAGISGLLDLNEIIQKNGKWDAIKNCTLSPKLNWAGLAVLFSKQLLNGSQDFLFCFNILIFIYFFLYKTIEIHARAFLPLAISAVGSVKWMNGWVHKSPVHGKFQQ